MNEFLDFMRWLDESNAAYLLMIMLFFAMAALQTTQANEVKRLRKLLKQAMR